jgi:hypothetical protein
MKVVVKIASGIWFLVDLLLRGVFFAMRLFFGLGSLGAIDLRYAHQTHKFEMIFMGTLFALMECLFAWTVVFVAQDPLKHGVWMLLLLPPLPWAAILNDYVRLRRQEAHVQREAERAIALGEAREQLRARLRGCLCINGQFVEVRMVLASDGTPVTELPATPRRPTDGVLFLADEGKAWMQLEVKLEEAEERHELANLSRRWRNYYGDPQDTRLMRIAIRSVQFRGHHFDGSVLIEPNSLAGIEPVICDQLNSSMRSEIRIAAAGMAGRDVVEPRIVGADPSGFDVRDDLGITRVPRKRSSGFAVDSEEVDDALEELDAAADEIEWDADSED